MSIEIANESGVGVDETSIVAAARFALDRMSVSPLAELSVLLVELEVMSDLHERWMDLEGPTDVMAFPMDELDSARRPDAADAGPALLGDIVLCPAFAKDQARTAGHSLLDDLHLLTVHGVLHLLGYDHAEPAEEREMFTLQKRILADFRTARVDAARRAAQRDADERLLSAVGLDLLGVLAAGAFGCADAALGTLSVARVEELARQGRPGAKMLATVVADRPRHINLLLLLRLTCELAATVLVTAVCLRDISPGWLAVLVASVSMVVVSYVLIGVGPRTIGRQHPYTVGLIAAGPVRVLGVVLGPLSRLLIMIGNMIIPGRGFRYGPFSSEVELRELVDLAGERGVVDDGEREMIHSVFELGDTIAREVMVPRTEIVWIERTKSVRQALALSLRTGFTRLPVVDDGVDDVVGVVNLKDLVHSSLDSAIDGSGT